MNSFTTFNLCYKVDDIERCILVAVEVIETDLEFREFPARPASPTATAINNATMFNGGGEISNYQLPKQPQTASTSSRSQRAGYRIEIIEQPAQKALRFRYNVLSVFYCIFNRARHVVWLVCFIEICLRHSRFPKQNQNIHKYLFIINIHNLFNYSKINIFYLE